LSFPHTRCKDSFRCISRQGFSVKYSSSLPFAPICAPSYNLSIINLFRLLVITLYSSEAHWRLKSSTKDLLCRYIDHMLDPGSICRRGSLARPKHDSPQCQGSILERVYICTIWFIEHGFIAQGLAEIHSKNSAVDRRRDTHRTEAVILDL
jgi:hypothetical protein